MFKKVGTPLTVPELREEFWKRLKKPRNFGGKFSAQLPWMVRNGYLKRVSGEGYWLAREGAIPA